MTTYIALLRGINVGGNNKISMAQLKRALDAMGLDGVQTYIQSGNVLFRSEEQAETLRGRIEREIQTAFGVSCTVMLRTSVQLERMIVECPFAVNTPEEGKRVHVGVLTEPLSQKQIDTLSAGIGELDAFKLNGAEIYMFYGQSILDSRLAKNLQKLGGVVTSRNWNTITKLAALAKAL